MKRLTFVNRDSARLALCSVAVVFFLGSSQPAFSVGVGAADVRSSLGEPLQISIPIFNVANPDQLVLSVNTPMFGGDPAKRLSVSLDRSNGQLAAKVFTPWAVMEPYVQFKLDLQDGATRQSKDFVLLLEFRPATGRIDPLRIQNSGVAQDSAVAVQPSASIQAQPLNTGRVSAASPTSVSPTRAANSVMGPYDWAQSGEVPDTFGAVLDGQSLWRVARRINSAMGVSVEQMMVALYEANPDAFYSDSISSLKAGSYLTIPDQQVVQQISEREAQRRVDALSSDQPPTTSQPAGDPVAAMTPVAEPVVESSVPTEAPTTAAPEIVEEVANTSDANESRGQPLFIIGDAEDVAAVASGAAESSAEAAPGSGAAQQEIIDSLSKTIGNLMQDNVDKEQRLQAMDERIKALENTLDNVGLDELAISAAEAPSQSNRTAWWLWLLPILAAIGAWLGLRARRQISTPEDDLFVQREQGDIEPHSVHVVGDEPQSQGFDEYFSDTDFSVMRSQRANQAADELDEDEIEGVSYHEYEEDVTPKEQASEVEHTIEFDTSNVATFPVGPRRDLHEALDNFIEERDFAAARDALDAARGKELDEPNYHFQRLRILLEKNDEHGFYEYFNMVENKFDDVDRDLKMDLADLVSRLNQK